MTTQYRRSAKYLRNLNAIALTVGFFGIVGFFLCGIAAYGISKWWPGDVEYPAAVSSGVVFIDDHYYVPHPMSRIQIYDEQWIFSHSFYVPSDGGVFSVSKGSDDSIFVHTARGNYVLQYSKSGELLTQRPYEYDYPDTGVLLVVPTAWYLWPASHPFGFWLLGFIGISLHIWLDKKRE